MNMAVFYLLFVAKKNIIGELAIPNLHLLSKSIECNKAKNDQKA
jgi:hypothetical protein